MIEMTCIYEDTKRRFLREGREVGREEGRIEGRKEGRIEGKEEGRAEGMTEGILKSRVDSINALMSNVNMTAEEAMDVLMIPEAERYALVSRIEH